MPTPLKFGGDGWIRTTVLLRTDLQSAAIDLSATSPLNTLLRMCVLKHTRRGVPSADSTELISSML